MGGGAGGPPPSPPLHFPFALGQAVVLYPAQPVPSPAGGVPQGVASLLGLPQADAVVDRGRWGAGGVKLTQVS